jgi:hypothetical protein
MGVLKKMWDSVKGRLANDTGFGRNSPAPDDLELPDPTPVPDASVFQQMQSVEEAIWPIPETTPVVATGVVIQVNKPLRLKMRSHA